MIKEIVDIKWNQSITAIMSFLGGLSPGLLIIFTYKFELFRSLDSIKLILLSVSISLPIFLVNMIGFILLQDKSKSEDPFEIAIFSLFVGGIQAYLSILISYVLGFSFNHFLFLFFCFFLVFMIVAYVGEKGGRKK